jgi:glycosyltransferase involved in cell wall biosynthesis
VLTLPPKSGKIIFNMKIAIIFASRHLDPQYSAVSVVENQLRMLIQNGHQPVLLLRTECKKSYKNLKGVEYRRCLPSFELYWYKNFNLRKEDRPWLKKTVKALYRNLKDADLVITHDIVSLPQLYVYNLAVRKVAKKISRLNWLHWIHSLSYGDNPLWGKAKRCKLVIPNYEQRGRMANDFGCRLGDVKTVYHFLDTLSFPLHPLTRTLIRSWDLLNADIVQLYPADARRLSIKQVNVVIDLFAKLKERDKKVRLVVANQYCIDDASRKKTESWMEHALKRGLSKKEIFFTSQFRPPRWEWGIPREVILELFRYVTNLFIFPSIAETFALVVLEAASGANLLVLNKDLSFLKDIIGKRNALFYRFGHFENPKDITSREVSNIADRIIKKLDQEICINARQRFRQRFSSDWVYKNQLQPLLRSFKNTE